MCVKNWLFKVAINEANNIKKSRWNKYYEIPMDYEMQTQEQSYTYEAIMKLKNKYRIIILLYYYCGYSIKEISKIVNRKESTIQTQLHRGRKKLGEVIKEDSV